MNAPPRARFDDLVGGSAFELRQPSAQFVAFRHEDVPAVLDDADRAARSGSWVAGFVAYEASPAFDPALTVHPGSSALPLAWFTAFSERADVPVISSQGVRGERPWPIDWSPERHAGAVARIKEHLAAGESYQVNLTVRARSVVDDPLALYAGMSNAQRGAYNAYLDTGSHVIACASPELFFERTNDRLVTRPMKGTRRRGRWSADDVSQAQALTESGKDRAEHVMIVDLLRNDMARVALTGSVKVRDLAALERYPTVWQLTSTIDAELAPGVGTLDLFTSLFPSGSVTGAPKASTMKIIADLEPARRGVYCGAVGYLMPGPAPAARFAVAIRSATIDLATGHTEYGTGGGITWASLAAEEWDEVQAKTAVLIGDRGPSALFETLRFDPTHGPVNLELHLERLAASADYFAVPFDGQAARAKVEAVCATAGRALRVRVDLSAAGALSVSSSDCPSPSALPVRLGLASERVDSRDVRLFHKSADRRRYDRIRATRPDVDDLLLQNERSEVTETTIANLAVQLDGLWYTPPLESGLLPGVERGRLIDLGRLRERTLTVADLRRSSALAVINSLRGWRQAVLAD